MRPARTPGLEPPCRTMNVISASGLDTSEGLKADSTHTNALDWMCRPRSTGIRWNGLGVNDFPNARGSSCVRACSHVCMPRIGRSSPRPGGWGVNCFDFRVDDWSLSVQSASIDF